MITPSHNDVIFGRGYAINNRPGNQLYRSLIANRKPLYDYAQKKTEKAKQAIEVVDFIYQLNPRGRFLTFSNPDNSGIYVEVDRKKAIRKATQALRDSKMRKKPPPPPSTIIARMMPITPLHNDVIFGRGYAILNRPGNLLYRSLIINRKQLYDGLVTKSEKAKLATSIVEFIYKLNPRGRFLTRDKDAEGKHCWIEVGKEKAIPKAWQALRDSKTVRPPLTLIPDSMPKKEDRKSPVVAGQPVDCFPGILALDQHSHQKLQELQVSLADRSATLLHQKIHQTQFISTYAHISPLTTLTRPSSNLFLSNVPPHRDYDASLPVPPAPAAAEFLDKGKEAALKDKKIDQHSSFSFSSSMKAGRSNDESGTIIHHPQHIHGDVTSIQEGMQCWQAIGNSPLVDSGDMRKLVSGTASDKFFNTSYSGDNHASNLNKDSPARNSFLAEHDDHQNSRSVISDETETSSTADAIADEIPSNADAMGLCDDKLRSARRLNDIELEFLASFQ